MHSSASHRRLLTILTLILVAVALTVGSAANAAVDPSVTAGAQARPNTSYLSAINPNCTHHVTTTGSDTNNNGTTLPTAWRTIGKALSTLRAGQTACVHAGTYNEDSNAVGNNGTPSAPITVRGAPGEARPVIVATADDPVFEIGKDLGYWVLDGFEINKNNTDDHAVRIDGGNHVTIRNVVIHDGRGPAGVSVYNGSYDVNLDNIEVSNFNRTVDGKRADAHGVAILRNVARVLVKGSRLHHNGGDGVQCQGVHDDDPIPRLSESDTSDVTLEDNRIYNNVENAIDVKSCQRVSIRGSVAPDQPGSAANNKLFGYRPTKPDDDLGTNHANGEAIVVHFYARGILIENTRIWDACQGVAIGRPDDSVTDVVIRRNLFFNLVNGTNCQGNGIRITKAQNVDIYHNTLDNIPNRAVTLGSDNTGDASNNYDVWNNIISNASAWIDLNRSKVTNFESNNNLFWNSDGSPNHLRLDQNMVSLTDWCKPSPAGTGQDANSRHADPLFVADPVSNDYYTQTSSPARDRALNNTNARFSGAGPDIGLRETYN